MNRQFYFQQMRFVLGIGGFMSFYGIAGLLIFASSKYFGIRPSMQIVIFAMLLITLPFALAGGYFYSRRKKKKEAAAKAAQEGEGKEDAADSKSGSAAKKPSGNYKEIGEGFAEVSKFLKSSNLGTGGKDAVYGLPWYLVVGDKGAGKSSLVLSSDLNFQALPSQNQKDLNFITPTRQIDWRVTSDAVFIDSSGRYQEEPDLDEWSTLVESIKKTRPKRPLDGLIVSVNLEELLELDERGIEQHAKTIRANLDDATKRLKAKFPVYVVFTHADSMEGFRDSFSHSKKDGDKLVWGSTFPLEKAENSQSLFDAEFEELLNSVMQRRLIRLSAPFSAVRQLRIFNFPLHFASARRKLGSFVSTLFRPNPFSSSPFLRGFYFTASPANLKRGRGKPGSMPKTLGDTFFTKKLFKDVILRDRDLVKTFEEQKEKPPIMGWLLTALGAMALMVFLGLSGLSLYNNKKLVDEASEAGEKVLNMTKEDAGKDVFKKGDDETYAELKNLEDLRTQLVRLDKWDREGAPIWYRFGFYSGSGIYRDRLLNIYYEGVERRFRVPTIQKLERDLTDFSKSSKIVSTALNDNEEKTLDKHYDLLKAYLMLTDEYKDFAESASLAESLKEIWVQEAKLPSGSDEVARRQLDFYVKQVDRVKSDESDRSAFPRNTQNLALVKAVRDRLQAFPAYLRYLKLSAAEVSRERGVVTLDSLLETRGKGVLKGNYQIPGAYTMEGYREHMKKAFEDAAVKMNKDDWVMGKKSEDSQATPEDLDKLQQKYFNDYTDHWRSLIRDIGVLKYKTSEDMTKVLQALSDTESPMKIILQEVEANTNFAKKPEAKGWLDFSWISDWWSGKNANQGEETLNIVEREFTPLFGFIGEEGADAKKGSPVSRYGSYVKELYQILNNITPGEKAKISAEFVEGDGKNYRSIKSVENGVTDLTRSFRSQAGKEIAELLLQPVSNVRLYFGADAKSQLEKDWTQRILPQAREIEKGFPFNSDGEADLTKVTAFLNPATGELSKFYKGSLERNFEEVDGVLKVKESSDTKFSPEFVAYLNRAFKLRKALYGEAATPNFEYEFRLLPVTDALIEVTIDGQSVTSNQTGSSKLKFPAATGTSTGVLMRFSSTEAGATLSPTAPSANPQPGSVNGTTPPNSGFQNSGTSELRYQGNWGLFRFFNSGNPQRGTNGDYLLTYKLGGKTVKASIKPSGGDLFDRSIFTNVKAPDKMLQ